MNNNAINTLLSCKTPKDIQACINAGSDINTLGDAANLLI